MGFSRVLIWDEYLFALKTRVAFLKKSTKNAVIKVDIFYIAQYDNVLVDIQDNVTNGQKLHNVTFSFLRINNRKCYKVTLLLTKIVWHKEIKKYFIFYCRAYGKM